MIALRSALLVSALSLAAVPAQDLSEDERAAVTKLCQPWDRDDGPGISVAIARGGEIVYRDGFGLAQLEYDQPIDPDTVFHVASVSKQFTAFSLVLLERDGVLSIDDDVRKHVPWLHDFGSKITIRHLLNHTSGIRDQWELLAMSGYRLDDVLTQEHILRILRNQRELNFEPGSEYLYSNMGFSLAAEVAQVASGAPFTEFCKERIFGPLQMNATHFHLDHRQIVPMRAYSYAPKGSGWQKGVLSYANVGATSLFTTASDLTRWLMNLGTGKVGGKAAIEALCTKGKLNDGEELSYALGIMVNQYKGQRAWRHSGGDAGFRSEALYFPDADLAVAVLANGSNIRPQTIANGIADVILADRLTAAEPRPREEPAAQRETVPIDDETLKRIEGRYTAESLPEIVVSRARSGARVEIVGQGRGRLLRSAADEYFVREAAITFEFLFGDGDIPRKSDNGQKLRLTPNPLNRCCEN